MPTQLIFRIIYRILYVLLFLLLLALLLATPGDIIRQALLVSKSYLILVIAACYFLTIVVVAFVYATRLYINRSVLASIPKSWIPINKGEVSEDVRQMIVDSLSRSAAIAFSARPRVAQELDARGSLEAEEAQGDKEASSQEKNRGSNGPLEKTSRLPPLKAVWGEIEHYGWASPESPDLPNLQYSTVLSELPNLIEAKALTLAPPDPESQSDPPMLDPEAVALLQRTDNMGLRDYLAHLAELQVLTPSATTMEFVSSYEYARFSTRPISNARFRELMHLFAEILRNMQPLAPEVLRMMLMEDEEYDNDDDDDPARSSDTDIDEDAPRGTSSPTTPRSRRSEQQSLRSRASTVSRRPSATRTTPSRQRPGPPGRNSSAGTWQYRTAPTTPKSRRTALSRSSSANSFAQTRRPYALSRASSASLRSASRQSSVIRLADQGTLLQACLTC